jgi:hypothetical protein
MLQLWLDGASMLVGRKGQVIEIYLAHKHPLQYLLLRQNLSEPQLEQGNG